MIVERSWSNHATRTNTGQPFEAGGGLNDVSAGSPYGSVIDWRAKLGGMLEGGSPRSCQRLVLQAYTPERKGLSSKKELRCCH